MADNRRAPYAGLTRKLIISVDVGSTYTASSFCLLQPGNVPKFEEATPDAKVPSVLYYDRSGQPKAFGAETDDEATEEQGWVKAEWWKLHLRPAHLPLIQNLTLPPLPRHVTVDDIFAHHFSYIKEQVKSYITATYGDGSNIWDALSPTMYIVLTTPNGWEGSQQNRMRKAAIKAGLVDADGGRRIRFVTEAEERAAVLYAVDSGTVHDWLVEDGQLILCDCGGGTVDITGYKINAVKPKLKLEEAAASRCYLAGAVFVTQAAKNFFEARLQGTEWATEEAMQRIVNHFDRNAKKKFSEEDKVCYVQLDGHKSNPSLNILRGRLKITGDEMASFFAEPLKQITEGLEIAFENGGRLADKIILVGGLASSPYLYSKLVKWGEEFGISVSKPEGPTVKAVANGALAWHLDSSVGSRISKYHYGITIGIPFNEADQEHKNRPTYKNLEGIVTVWWAWSGIIHKNAKLESSKEFAEDFILRMSNDKQDFNHTVAIYVYRRASPPNFLTFPGRSTLQPGFEKICSVVGDLENCYHATRFSTSPDGVKYKKVKFEVCLYLGETEITARLRWKENVGNSDVYGPATIAYD
ncbi:hypothetical protein C8J57DRAFT_1058266 [Mycena rebaudengoi]|nr:hypothetical protein C8J57DRAFT_1058266 [Mycena rebaudengoi]